MTIALIVHLHPHSIILRQISGLQPRLLVVVLCFSVPVWLPTAVCFALMRWPLFSNFVTLHDAAYQTIFFFVQLGLVATSAAFLSCKYASPIWRPQPALRRGILTSLIILLPLLLYYLSQGVFGILNATLIAGLGPEGAQAIASLHQETWGRLAYDSSLAGVVCSSLMSFAAPVLEEVVFTGLLINATVKSYGFAAGVMIVPVGFALVHGFQFGVGLQLVPLLFSGLTYALVRLYSGSLLMSVFGHWTINIAILLPKWTIAVMHFTRGR